jgi:hypothetical protein
LQSTHRIPGTARRPLRMLDCVCVCVSVCARAHTMGMTAYTLLFIGLAVYRHPSHTAAWTDKVWVGGGCTVLSSSFTKTRGMQALIDARQQRRTDVPMAPAPAAAAVGAVPSAAQGAAAAPSDGLADLVAAVPVPGHSIRTQSACVCARARERERERERERLHTRRRGNAHVRTCMCVCAYHPCVGPA